MSIVAIQGGATGTGTVTVVAPSTSTNRTLTLPDVTGTVVSTGSTAVVSQAMLATGVAGNGPAFSAYLDSTQSVSNSTNTKVSINTEEFDTANCFNTTTNRFTPTVAGYYQFNFQISVRSSTSITRFACYVWKNGSGAAPSKNGGDIKFNSAGDNGYKIGGSGLIYANGTTDYFEMYAYVETAAGTNVFNGGTGGVDSYFQGYLVRAA